MEFKLARDFLLSNRGDYETAYREFRWPHPETFNWALDWFDSIAPSAEIARSIFEHPQSNLAGYKRIRRLEFAELPKTISGKIRRVDLRGIEAVLREQRDPARAGNEYWEEDFPGLHPASSP
jgi:hypothetical protein